MPRESSYFRLYVILNDGESYSGKMNCVIYDAEKNKIYSIRKGEEINAPGITHWDKGITNIIEYNQEIDDMKEEEVHNADDDGILGK
jgi:hypothetical protein